VVFGEKNVGQRAKADCQPETGHNCRADGKSVSLTEGYKHTQAESESGP
jgi:hypothetical protein